MKNTLPFFSISLAFMKPEISATFFSDKVEFFLGFLPDIFMVSEMVQNSQSLYSFTFTAVIVIHEYIYSHSTTKFTFKK